MNKNINRKKFINFLKSRGCEILAITNEYEMVRWKGHTTGILYKSGKTSGEYAHKAAVAYKFGKKWDGGPKKIRRVNSSEKLVNTLLDRDGDICIVCGKKLTHVSIEHLLPIVFGGSNHIANLCLVHPSCNRKVNNMTLTEKINYIVARRNKLNTDCWINKQIKLFNYFIKSPFQNM